MPTKAETKELIDRHFKNISQVEFEKRLREANPWLAEPPAASKGKRTPPKATASKSVSKTANDASKAPAANKRVKQG